ncbi:MAG: beta-ketoacyl-ACP synthase I, partial [Gammaproteobacteria bacterium]|nr:beta-ketoacyl-ACP synthase I [Gammaproteobacteria bacterium]
MRRVAVTGLGIVSCLGNELSGVDRALREGRSGVRFAEAYREAGLRSWICGLPDLTHEPPIERRHRRFMADPAIYAFHALRKAIDDAQLAGGCVSHPATGLVVGSGTGSVLRLIEAVDTLRESGVARVPPYAVPQVMA